MSLMSNSCNKFECEMCGKIYKRHSGLANHVITIKDANTMKGETETKFKTCWECSYYD